MSRERGESEEEREESGEEEGKPGEASVVEAERQECMEEKEWPPVWNVTAGSTEAVRIWARQVQCGDGQKPARNGQTHEWAGGGVKARASETMQKVGCADR